jgi:teichoic acid glycerol-phosphate primase
MRRAAVILFGNSPHHLDHLAPLSSLLKLPLIVEDKKILLLAQKYYPKTDAIFRPIPEFYFYCLQHFTTLITCFPRPHFDIDFFLPQHLLKKRAQTIWCPHGNSDKGRASFFMEGLQKEELLLVYGERMESFVKEKGVASKCLQIGNYRFDYFVQNKKFYQSLLKREVLPTLCKGKKTLLYAPTWEDSERSSSIEKFLFPLLDSYDGQCNLIFKPHPNLFHSHFLQMESLKDLFKKRKGLLFLEEFSPIYSLLSIVDAYLGDMSSIGYDFLTFQKPMFFLANPDHRSAQSSYFLYQCGNDLSKENPSDVLKKIVRSLQENKRNPFSKIQKEIYASTFSQSSYFEELKSSLKEQKKDSLI